MSSREIPAPANDTTAYEIVRLEDLEDPLVRLGVEHWQTVRGERAYPSRDQIDPKAIARALHRIIILKVIDGGEDFEFAIVGDEVNRAYRVPFARRRLSAISRDLPNSAAFWGTIYRDICRTGKAWAVRMFSGFDGETNFSHGEAALLPLGPVDGVVDHIITFSKRAVTRA
ncbi:MAG: PAS domain-containing protein [Alphaproteobacteria bacterium]|nr:PAS domain-containing protein [Alphaproteobacteria bacterium]